MSTMVSLSRSQFTIERLRDMVRDATVGDKLPAEKELAAQLGVSRVTVRDALARLWQEGIIVRKWGSGTFVAEPSVATTAAPYNNFFIDSNTVGSLPARIAAAGHDVTLHSFEVTTEPIPSWVREEHGFQVPLWNVSRCMHIDGVPAVLIHDYLPQEVGGVSVDPHSLDHLEQDLQTFLRGIGERIVKQEALLLAKSAEPAWAAALQLEPGDPVLVGQQRSVAEDGKVVVCSDLVYRGDGLGQILVRTLPE